MRIEERDAGGVTILDLHGRFVVEDGVDAFVERLNALVRRGRRRILLNFAGVTFLDSAGVGAVAWKYVTTRKHDGDLKLLHLQRRAFTILETTKLLTVIQNYESEADAIESFYAEREEDDVDPIFT